MTRIALLDYGMGNLHSAAKALEYVGATVDVTNDPAKIRAADKIVFPGVGAMRDCMQEMRESGVDVSIKQMAQQKPILAICVGMQALFDASEENGEVPALGIFGGKVVRFADKNGLKVPHMGWNTVEPTNPEHAMWKGIAPQSRFYFVHSYYVKPNDSNIIAATTHYDTHFSCAVSKDNLFAVQFHPEKSHTVGLQLLKNFVEWKV